MIKVSVDYTIPFFDVDTYKIVWHGNYAKYFEIARCRLLDEIDYNYQAMEKSGYFFPVIDLYAKYVRPIKFEQAVKITAELVQWESYLRINYQIIDAVTNEVLTKGYTRQVAISMPDEVVQLVAPPMLISKISAALK